MRSSAVTVRLLLIFIVLLVSSNAAPAQESATRGRRATSGPAAEAIVTINEQFLNSFLTAIFDNLQEPSMPLTIGGAASSAQCASEIRLKREVGGVRTAVHFENGRIVGPLAFAGAYYLPLLGCFQFSGWADSEVNLEFNSERRALVARFRLRDIHLNDVPVLANGALVNMVQTAIDQRYNPVDLFSLDQLSTRVNIQPAKGALQLRAKDIRPEITPAGLILHIIYEFVKG
jgi:hypothetical protein